MKVIECSEDRLVLDVDATLYPEPVVFKCFYWYGDRFTVDIQREAEDRLRVSLLPHDPIPDWTQVQTRIRRDLIDFRTRQIVADETRAVRELIAAKAFASLDPLPLAQPGDVTDPVGFEISDFDAPAE